MFISCILYKDINKYSEHGVASSQMGKHPGFFSDKVRRHTFLKNLPFQNLTVTTLQIMDIVAEALFFFAEHPISTALCLKLRPFSPLFHCHQSPIGLFDTVRVIVLNLQVLRSQCNSVLTTVPSQRECVQR